MKNLNQAEICWQQKHFDYATGYYELGMLDDAELELNRIDACVAAQSVQVLDLRLAISYCRRDWGKMKTMARRLFLLDSSNPNWAFADGFATAEIESVMSKRRLIQIFALMLAVSLR